MSTIQVILSGIIALGILVFVHELGHFLVAKLAGIRVLKFSLGFGQKIVGFKHGDTEYLISALPLGGYVKLAGEQAAEGDPVEPGDYFWRPWWVRIGVLAAGPAMNLLAAGVVLGSLFWAGLQVPLAQPQVVAVTVGSPAARAGILPGDVITALNGQPQDDWEAFAKAMDEQARSTSGAAQRLTVLRQGQEQAVEVTPHLDGADQKYRIGITLSAASSTVISRVFVGTPAESAGFKNADRIAAVEDQAVWTKWDFQNALAPRIGQPTRIRVQRGGQTLDLTVTPMAQELPERGRTGVIGVNFKSSDAARRVAYPFAQAYGMGFKQTYVMSKTILVSLGQMVTGKLSMKDSLGGPITIVRMAGQEARSGLQDFLFFLAGISIMLAVLNLLPVPVLDGGNALLFLVEGIMRRPIPAKWQENFQRVGFALLVALMVYATFNDIQKLVAPWFGGPK